VKRNIFTKGVACLISVSVLVTDCAFAQDLQMGLWNERRNVMRHDLAASLQAPLAPLPSSGISPQSLSAETPFNAIIKNLPRWSGDVSGVYQPGSPPKRVVIEIEDVHLNLEAQRNISLIVQQLSQAGQCPILALEGAFRPLDFSRIRAFGNQTLLRRIEDCLLREKKISGAVHAALVSYPGPASIVGIDDSSRYHENVAAYRQAVSRNLLQKERLSDWRKDLETRKSRVFSPRLAQFDSRVEAYASGSERLSTYLDRVLASLPSSIALANHPNVAHLARALRLEASIRWPQAQAEAAALSAQLLRRLSLTESHALLGYSVGMRLSGLPQQRFYRYLTGLCRQHGVPLSKFPEFERYRDYVVEAGAVDGGKVFEETVQLEEAAYSHLAKTPEERQLIQESQLLRLVQKLIDFSLTSAQWNTYKSLRSVVASGLVEQAALKDLAPFEAFYKHAISRDHAMAQNLLGAFQQRNVSTAVVVCGGFHSPGLTSQLLAAGIAVIRLRPRMAASAETDGSAYLTIFAREKAPLEKLFAGERLFLTPDPAGGVPEIPFAAAALSDVPQRTLQQFVPGSAWEVESTGLSATPVSEVAHLTAVNPVSRLRESLTEAYTASQVIGISSTVEETSPAPQLTIRAALNQSALIALLCAAALLVTAATVLFFWWIAILLMPAGPAAAPSPRARTLILVGLAMGAVLPLITGKGSGKGDEPKKEPQDKGRAKRKKQSILKAPEPAVAGVWHFGPGEKAVMNVYDVLVTAEETAQALEIVGTRLVGPKLKQAEEFILFKVMTARPPSKNGWVRWRTNRIRKTIFDFLVNKNTPLAIDEAKKMGSTDVFDTAEDGVIGIIDGVRRFKYWLGYKLSTTLAGRKGHIRNKIRTAKNSDRTVRHPAYMYGAIRYLESVIQALSHDLGRPPSVEELMKSTGLPRDDIEMQLKEANGVSSIDHEDAQGYRPPEPPDPFPDVMDLDADELAAYFSVLTRAEQVVLKLRFGWGVERPYQLKEIGERIGLSKEWVRQKQKRALQKIRDYAESGTRPGGEEPFFPDHRDAFVTYTLGLIPRDPASPEYDEANEQRFKALMAFSRPQLEEQEAEGGALHEAAKAFLTTGDNWLNARDFYERLPENHVLKRLYLLMPNVMIGWYAAVVELPLALVPWEFLGAHKPRRSFRSAPIMVILHWTKMALGASVLYGASAWGTLRLVEFLAARTSFGLPALALLGALLFLVALVVVHGVLDTLYVLPMHLTFALLRTARRSEGFLRAGFLIPGRLLRPAFLIIRHPPLPLNTNAEILTALSAGNQKDKDRALARLREIFSTDENRRRSLLPPLIREQLRFGESVREPVQNLISGTIAAHTGPYNQEIDLKEHPEVGQALIDLLNDDAITKQKYEDVLIWVVGELILVTRSSYLQNERERLAGARALMKRRSNLDADGQTDIDNFVDHVVRLIVRLINHGPADARKNSLRAHILAEFLPVESHLDERTESEFLRMLYKDFTPSGLRYLWTAVNRFVEIRPRYQFQLLEHPRAWETAARAHDGAFLISLFHSYYADALEQVDEEWEGETRLDFPDPAHLQLLLDILGDFTLGPHIPRVHSLLRRFFDVFRRADARVNKAIGDRVKTAVASFSEAKSDSPQALESLGALRAIYRNRLAHPTLPTVLTLLDGLHRLRTHPSETEVEQRLLINDIVQWIPGIVRTAVDDSVRDDRWDRVAAAVRYLNAPIDVFPFQGFLEVFQQDPSVACDLLNAVAGRQTGGSHMDRSDLLILLDDALLAYAALSTTDPSERSLTDLHILEDTFGHLRTLLGTLQEGDDTLLNIRSLLTTAAADRALGAAALDTLLRTRPLVEYFDLPLRSADLSLLMKAARTGSLEVRNAAADILAAIPGGPQPLPMIPLMNNMLDLAAAWARDRASDPALKDLEMRPILHALGSIERRLIDSGQTQEAADYFSERLSLEAEGLTSNRSQGLLLIPLIVRYGGANPSPAEVNSVIDTVNHQNPARKRASVRSLDTLSTDLLRRFNGQRPPGWTDEEMIQNILEPLLTGLYGFIRWERAHRAAKDPTAWTSDLESLTETLGRFCQMFDSADLRIGQHLRSLAESLLVLNRQQRPPQSVWSAETGQWKLTDSMDRLTTDERQRPALFGKAPTLRRSSYDWGFIQSHFPGTTVALPIRESLAASVRLRGPLMSTEGTRRDAIKFYTSLNRGVALRWLYNKAPNVMIGWYAAFAEWEDSLDPAEFLPAHRNRNLFDWLKRIAGLGTIYAGMVVLPLKAGVFLAVNTALPMPIIVAVAFLLILPSGIGVHGLIDTLSAAFRWTSVVLRWRARSLRNSLARRAATALARGAAVLQPSAMVSGAAQFGIQDLVLADDELQLLFRVARQRPEPEEFLEWYQTFRHSPTLLQSQRALASFQEEIFDQVPMGRQRTPPLDIALGIIGRALAIQVPIGIDDLKLDAEDKRILKMAISQPRPSPRDLLNEIVRVRQTTPYRARRHAIWLEVQVQKQIRGHYYGSEINGALSRIEAIGHEEVQIEIDDFDFSTTVKDSLRIALMMGVNPRATLNQIRLRQGAQTEFHTQRVLAALYQKVRMARFDADFSDDIDRVLRNLRKLDRIVVDIELRDLADYYPMDGQKGEWLETIMREWATAAMKGQRINLDTFKIWVGRPEYSTEDIRRVVISLHALATMVIGPRHQDQFLQLAMDNLEMIAFPKDKSPRPPFSWKTRRQFKRDAFLGFLGWGIVGFLVVGLAVEVWLLGGSTWQSRGHFAVLSAVIPLLGGFLTFEPALQRETNAEMSSDHVDPLLDPIADLLAATFLQQARDGRVDPAALTRLWGVEALDAGESLRGHGRGILSLSTNQIERLGVLVRMRLEKAGASHLLPAAEAQEALLAAQAAISSTTPTPLGLVLAAGTGTLQERRRSVENLDRALAERSDNREPIYILPTSGAGFFRTLVAEPPYRGRSIVVLDETAGLLRNGEQDLEREVGVFEERMGPEALAQVEFALLPGYAYRIARQARPSDKARFLPLDYLSSIPLTWMDLENLSLLLRTAGVSA